MTESQESMEFDVLIVGGGPAGLSAAIRLAQLAKQHQRALSVAVLEKGAAIGAHLLSGAVLETSALDELIPDWQTREAPIHVGVKQDDFYYLSKQKAYRLPTPPDMRNDGNFIISLGRFCQWLATQAEQLGVNIFPRFAATKILFDENNTVIGIKTGDMGLNKQGQHSERFQPGFHLYAKHTLLAEGCRGYLTEQIIAHYELRSQCDPQTYGIGIKELWQVPESSHQLGRVIHTVGWPLDQKTYGGSFIYHAENSQIAIGFVVGLDYQNPYLDPFQEFQRFKTHPFVREFLKDGQCIGYGAKALNEGGWQSIPQLEFPGGLIMGCAAGFLNVGKIKGNHTAMKSGILAAESIFNAQSYQKAMMDSSIYKELYRVRNLRPAFRYGLWPGMIYAAFDQYILRGHALWTLHHQADHNALKPANQCKPISYPKPDGKLTFDRLTQVYLSNTQHREDQPCHLVLKNPEVAIKINLATYDAPEQRYCPAGVYEIVNTENQPTLQINAANCVHCKTCDIKDPTQNIIWKPPEGGDGPNYEGL